MAVKIRLQRHGAKQRPYYFIVVADHRSPRDGKFIEKLGTYNPLSVPATISINRDRALYWLNQGAQPTDTARRILSFKGVLYLKHLLRGVKLGLFDEATAQQKFDTWLQQHEQDVERRNAEHAKKKQEKKYVPVVKKVDEPVEAPAQAAETETTADAQSTSTEPVADTTTSTEGAASEA